MVYIKLDKVTNYGGTVSVAHCMFQLMTQCYPFSFVD